MASGEAKTDARPAPSERGLSPVALAYRRAEPYTAATSTLLGAVAGCTAAGWALDRWLGHRVQWMLIAGAVIGIVLGFVGFFAQVLRADGLRRAARAGSPPPATARTPSGQVGGAGPRGPVSA